MARPRVDAIAELLRKRLLRARETGVLKGGARLPSTRELAAELAANERVVAAAYRRLADEGLVDMRPRAGVYLAPDEEASAERAPDPAWLGSMLADAVCHGVSAPRLSEWLAHATARRLRATVIATTVDQCYGMCRELQDDLGLRASTVLAEEMARGTLPESVRLAHLLVTTEAHRERIGHVALRLAKPLVVVAPRADLFTTEWIGLLQREVFVIAADPRFLALVAAYIAGGPGAANVRMLVAGRDDLSVIPPGALTYVTQAARAKLGTTRLPGRVVRPPRILSEAGIREILAHVAEINIRRAARG